MILDLWVAILGKYIQYHIAVSYLLCCTVVFSWNRINWAYGNMTKLTPRNRDGWTQVHVSFSINNLETKVTEEHLRGIFEKYGGSQDDVNLSFNKSVMIEKVNS